MKKASRIFLTVFILGLLIVPLAGCNSKSTGTSAAANQEATVQRGNLSVGITAAGNLALSHTEDLSSEISGTQQDPVTVQEVLVKAGDSVKAGQMLARLNVTTLEDKVTSQKRIVQTAEQTLQTAESNLAKAIQDGDIQIKTAEIDLETATINFNKLNYPFSSSTFAFDIPAAIDDINTAQRQLEAARPVLQVGPGTENYSQAMEQFRKAQSNLDDALERLLGGQSIDAFTNVDNRISTDNKTIKYSTVVSDYLTARAAKITVDKAQYSLEQAKTSVQINLNKANLAVENAKDDLVEAQKNLVDYQNDVTKSEIVAPFNGFVTKVNVSGGEAVQKGTILVQVADPTKFEAGILVNEMDILKVKLGGDAQVQVSAVTGLTLPAKVTAISPTATIQSGVVNYSVKVEVQPLTSVTQQLPAAQQGASAPTQQSRQGTRQAQQGNFAGPINFELKEGLSVTVNIIMQQKSDVLLVPSAAISRQSGQSYVQVVSSNGTEKRAIKTGITDYANTEVTSGLSEGEKVVIPQLVAPTSSTQSSGPQRIIIPGAGGFGR